MRFAFLIIPTLLSSVSATITSSSDHPLPSLQLRSPPVFHKPTKRHGDKVHHVPIQRSPYALPKHYTLRGVLGLGQDHIGRSEGESTASVQLTGHTYVANVTIGEQEMPVLIDTGSADLWVAPDSFVCLDEDHNEAQRETCNIPVYFQGTFSGGVLEDEYFSISCTCRLAPVQDSPLRFRNTPPEHVADKRQTQVDSTSMANMDMSLLRWGESQCPSNRLHCRLLGTSTRLRETSRASWA